VARSSRWAVATSQVLTVAISSELKSAGGRRFERSNGRICVLEPPWALACERRLEDSIVRRMRTDEQKRALCDRDRQSRPARTPSPPGWPRGCRAGQAAYLFP
jgi:hypothetical protein